MWSHGLLPPCSPQSAHITLIDALMTAYTSERVSSDRPGSSSGRLSFSQSPLDLEGSLVCWVNKVLLGSAYFIYLWIL